MREFSTPMSKVKIAPSIICADFGNLEKELAALERAGADLLHADVMDGHFVQNFALNPTIIHYICSHSRIPVEVHLVVEEPERFIDLFSTVGASIITVHVESTNNIVRVINRIKQLGIKASVAINPATPVGHLDYILEYLDMVVVMAVNPGFRGQVFLARTVDKIEAIRNLAARRKQHLDIEVDGGMNERTAQSVCRAGANVIIGGAAIFDTGKSREESIRRLRDACVPIKSSRK